MFGIETEIKFTTRLGTTAVAEFHLGRRSWNAPTVSLFTGARRRMSRHALLAGPSPRSGLGVRRDKAALSSGCKSHPAIAPAGSSRSSQGGNELAEAFGMRVTNW